MYDLGLTTLLRMRHGIVKGPVEAITYSDLDHLSHRLRKLGLTHEGTLAALSALTVLCCIGAMVIVNTTGVIAMICAVGTIGIVLGLLGWYLDKNTSQPQLWLKGRNENLEGWGDGRLPLGKEENQCTES